MKLIYDVVAALAFVAGIGLFIAAVYTPFNYSADSLPILQATAIYNKAIYFGVLSIAAFVFAGVLFLSTKDDDKK